MCVEAGIIIRIEKEKYTLREKKSRMRAEIANKSRVKVRWSKMCVFSQKVKKYIVAESFASTQ